jgi:signal transduction histidine kinase/ligand-binding sensor domain-containing protein
VLRTLLTSFFASLIACCYGQSYTVLQYSKTEGVPSAEVYEVYQDKKGFLWFATDNGVARFDGSEMKIFHTRQGLSDEVVFGFYEDYKNRLWFRTFSGNLSYFENDSIYAYPYNDQLSKLNSKSIIGSILVDSLDQLWFTTLRSTGLIGKIDREGKTELEYMEGYQMHYQEIGNDVLLGYKQISFQRVSINGNVLPFIYSTVCSQFQVLSVRWKGRIYFSMCHDLYEFDGKQFRHILTKPLPILSLSKDKEDNLWIGYFSGGADRYSSREFKESWSPEFLRNVSVTKVLQDHNRGFWFSTLERGVLHVPDLAIRNYVLDPAQKIQFVAATDNQVLVSTIQGNVISFDGAGKIQNTKTFAPPITDLFICKNKNTWISNDIGTSVLDAEFRLWKKYPFLMTSLSEEYDGSVWGLNGKHIARFNSQGDLILFRRTDLYCRKLFVHDSLLLLATRNGVNFHNRNGDFLKAARELNNFKISGVHRMDSTLFLITTIGDGFILFDIQNKTRPWYSTENKFIANTIYCSVKAGDMLWLGTEKGIIKLNADSLLRGKLILSVLNNHSGVISDQINHLRSLPPFVWAFSDHGFSIIPAHTPPALQEVPEFYLKYFTVNSKKLAPEKNEYRLKYNENNIQFAFGFIAFNHPPLYNRYRLGTNTTWNYTENKTIAFNALAAGTYRLELEYSHDNIHWVPAFISQAWVIEPPFWQTWYFLTAVALSTVFIIFLYFRNQVNIYRKHQQKLIQSEIEAIEQERSRIAKDLHDSVGTDFSAIKMTVNQLLKKHNDPKSEEIETHFQSTIQDIKSIIYGLAPPGLERYGLITAVNNYINKLNGTISPKIELHTFGPDIKDPGINIAVFRVLQELISNSLKHSDAQSIALHINSFEDLLNIVYEDNGKGFSWDAANKGLGLYNIESRIQSVKGQLRFDSGPFGTSYAIDIPLKKDQPKL